MHTSHCTPATPALDLFSLIENEARAVTTAFGIRSALTHEIAAALVDRLHHQMRGDSIYIAKRSKARRQEAYDAMRREFTGVNLREVASRHGFSVRQARRILLRG